MNAFSPSRGDPRITVIRAGVVPPGGRLVVPPGGCRDAILREGIGADAPNEAWFQPAAVPPHAANCACCQQRNPVGIAIAALLFAAARGQAPPFQRLVVITATPAGADAIDHALAYDPLVRARCCYSGAD